MNDQPSPPPPLFTTVDLLDPMQPQYLGIGLTVDLWFGKNICPKCEQPVLAPIRPPQMPMPDNVCHTCKIAWAPGATYLRVRRTVVAPPAPVVDPVAAARAKSAEEAAVLEAMEAQNAIQRALARQRLETGGIGGQAREYTTGKPPAVAGRLAAGILGAGYRGAGLFGGLLGAGVRPKSQTLSPSVAANALRDLAQKTGGDTPDTLAGFKVPEVSDDVMPEGVLGILGSGTGSEGAVVFRDTMFGLAQRLELQAIRLSKQTHDFVRRISEIFNPPPQNPSSSCLADREGVAYPRIMQHLLRAEHALSLAAEVWTDMRSNICSPVLALDELKAPCPHFGTTAATLKEVRDPLPLLMNWAEYHVAKMIQAFLDVQECLHAYNDSETVAAYEKQHREFREFFDALRQEMGELHGIAGMSRLIEFSERLSSEIEAARPLSQFVPEHENAVTPAVDPAKNPPPCGLEF